MPLSIEDVVRFYLTRQEKLGQIRDWLARFQWDLDEEGQLFAGEVDDAIVHFDDGYIDENDLRLWLSTVLERRTIGTAYLEIRLNAGPLVATTSRHTRTVATTSNPIPVSNLIPVY